MWIFVEDHMHSSQSMPFETTFSTTMYGHHRKVWLCIATTIDDADDDVILAPYIPGLDAGMRRAQHGCGFN